MLFVEVISVLADVGRFMIVLGWSKETWLDLSECSIWLIFSNLGLMETFSFGSRPIASLLANLSLGPLLQLISQIWCRFTKLILHIGGSASLISCHDLTARCARTDLFDINHKGIVISVVMFQQFLLKNLGLHLSLNFIFWSIPSILRFCVFTASRWSLRGWWKFKVNSDPVISWIFNF